MNKIVPWMKFFRFSGRFLRCAGWNINTNSVYVLIYITGGNRKRTATIEKFLKMKHPTGIVNTTHYSRRFFNLNLRNLTYGILRVSSFLLLYGVRDILELQTPYICSRIIICWKTQFYILKSPTKFTPWVLTSNMPMYLESLGKCVIGFS